MIPYPVVREIQLLDLGEALGNPLWERAALVPTIQVEFSVK